MGIRKGPPRKKPKFRARPKPKATRLDVLMKRAFLVGWRTGRRRYTRIQAEIFWAKGKTP